MSRRIPHADCLLVITRAEMRMANEVDAAQERGDLSMGGSDNDPVRGLDGVGLDRRPAWQRLAFLFVGGTVI